MDQQCLPKISFIKIGTHQWRFKLCIQEDQLKYNKSLLLLILVVYNLYCSLERRAPKVKVRCGKPKKQSDYDCDNDSRSSRFIVKLDLQDHARLQARAARSQSSSVHIYLDSCTVQLHLSRVY